MLDLIISVFHLKFLGLCCNNVISDRPRNYAFETERFQFYMKISPEWENYSYHKLQLKTFNRTENVRLSLFSSLVFYSVYSVLLFLKDKKLFSFFMPTGPLFVANFLGSWIPVPILIALKQKVL